MTEPSTEGEVNNTSQVTALELAELQQQVEQTRAELERLQQEVIQAESQFESGSEKVEIPAETPVEKPLDDVAGLLLLSKQRIQIATEHTEAALVELEQSQQNVAELESQLEQSQNPHVLAVNEQLVLSMLQAHSEAETSARALSEASRLAEFDTLTDLPNRMLLLDRFIHSIANAKRRKDRVALLFLDLNKFKDINDSFGHAVGDQALKIAAQCFTACVRESDTVSRHGGDEFLILLAEVTDIADVMVIANKLIVSLGKPTHVGEHILHLKTSIGISIYPDDGEDADTLIDRADKAMYRAKKQGLGSYAFYGDEAINQESGATSASAHYATSAFKHERRHGQRRETSN